MSRRRFEHLHSFLGNLVSEEPGIRPRSKALQATILSAMQQLSFPLLLCSRYKATKSLYQLGPDDARLFAIVSLCLKRRDRSPQKQ